MSTYSRYKEEISEDLQASLERLGCLPILFIGSGMSKRYFNAPSWGELLSMLCQQNPLSKDYAYYRQLNGNDYPSIGSQVTQDYVQYAWGEGKDKFPKELFSEHQNADVFIKTAISDYLRDITPENIHSIKNEQLMKELASLISIRPYSMITTNYDSFLESIFPDYAPIVGETLLHSQYTSIGEIFKIHGCVSDPNSLVLSKEDYVKFMERKKYLTAKLLTFFLEHPMVILGYSASDENIQAILSDIDEILATKDSLVENIYIVSYNSDIDENENYPKEKIIRLANGKSIRLKNIVADKYDWIFNSLVSKDSIERINPKLLRGLIARTHQLIRKDIPSRKIEIDYDTLEHALDNDEEIKNIFGITNLSENTQINVRYPYSLTAVGKGLGYGSWHGASDLLNLVRATTGIHLRGSDNPYHIQIPTGETSFTRRYSAAAIDLLKKVRDGEDYKLEGI